MTQAAQVQAPEGPVEASPEPSPLVERVLRPMFASRTVAEFEAGLEDWLHEGAVLYMRQRLARAGKPPQTPTSTPGVSHRVVADELDQRASACLSPDRSFKVRRALEQILVSGMPTQRQTAAAFQGATWDPTVARDFARVAETAVDASTLSLGWTYVLAGALPTPNPEVADVASSVFLRATAACLSAQSAWLNGEWPPVAAYFRASAPVAWFAKHPALAAAFLLRGGHAFCDDATVGVHVDLFRDPEDEDLDVLRILVHTTDDPDEAQDRIERRSLRSGVLGCSVDASGAAVIVVTERVASA